MPLVKPEAYCGKLDLLEQAGDTIWGGPDEVVAEINLERLGFKPTHRICSILFWPLASILIRSKKNSGVSDSGLRLGNGSLIKLDLVLEEL